jgi:hypothetical protein
MTQSGDTLNPRADGGEAKFEDVYVVPEYVISRRSGLQLLKENGDAEGYG